MKRIYGVVTLVAALMGAVLLLERTAGVAAAAPTGVKNVVLVHGAFADGSGWESVAKILEKDGYRVSVAQPPRDLLRRRPEVHEGRNRRRGRASSSGGTQLWRICHHRGWQSSQRRGTRLYRGLRAR